MQEEDEKSIFSLLFEVLESKSKINENKIFILQEKERVKTMKNKIDGEGAKSRGAYGKRKRREEHMVAEIRLN